MEVPKEFYFALGFIVTYLLEGITCLFESYYCRKAKHICSDCKAWSCQGKHCEYKRKKKAGE